MPNSDTKTPALVPKHPMAEAINYALNQWAELNVFCSDGAVPMDPASVHGLTEPFALSQQMISKHIAYLVRARIVIKTWKRERVHT
jgi:transposase IS66 family protein